LSKGCTAYPFEQGTAIRRATPLIAFLLTLVAVTGWSQELDRDELNTTAGRAFAFANFTGPQPVVETAARIKGIGVVLGRTLRAGSGRGSYFGKYDVIRAFDPAQTSLLSADIIVFGADARVDHIRNVRRIIAGYLETAFGYSTAQANRLAELVTNYNAVYRGNIAALSRIYTSQVMSHLSAENAGLALGYADWPGKTRLVIPLRRAAGSQARTAPAPGAGTAAPSPAPAGARPGTSTPSPAAAGTGTGPGATAPSPAPAGTAPGATAPSPTPAGGSRAGAPAPSGTTTQSGGSGAVSSAEGAPTAAPSAQPDASVPGEGGPVGGTLPGRGPSWLILVAVLLIAAVVLLAIVGAWVLRSGLRPSLVRGLFLSAREGHPLVEMIVTTQNRHIGFRNVHYLRPGSSAAVGGGRSTFLVYFVPVPSRIAYLTYDGQSYTFVPVRSDLFADLTGPVPDCLGKEIPARSPRGYRFTIVFRRFLPPLEEINRLMRSIRTPTPKGLPPAATGLSKPPAGSPP